MLHAEKLIVDVCAGAIADILEMDMCASMKLGQCRYPYLPTARVRDLYFCVVL